MGAKSADFDRMTQLMNLTYAYKHPSDIDPQTGQVRRQADFALPKFIYLLGHDLIDVNKPEQTLAAIEIANQFGIPAVKEMQAMLKSGASLVQVTERFPIPAHAATDKTKQQNGKNGVIAKGSTMQLDTAEDGMTNNVNAANSKINATTALRLPDMLAAQPNLAQGANI